MAQALSFGQQPRRRPASNNTPDLAQLLNQRPTPPAPVQSGFGGGFANELPDYSVDLSEILAPKRSTSSGAKRTTKKPASSGRFAASRSSTTKRRKRPRRAKPKMDTEEQGQFYKELGSKTLGGLETVGNILDAPAGFIRNAISGHNPLDSGVVDASERKSGRDLLEQAGILGENTKGLDFGDVAGFAAEIALDPLTYATLGASALGKAGALLKKAGALNKLDTGVKLGSKTGRRIRTRVKDIIEEADELQLKNIDNTARSEGFEGISDFVAKHGDDQLGGMARFGAFGSEKLLGTSEVAAKAADVVRESRPVTALLDNKGSRAVRSMFGSATRGATSRLGQMFFRGVSENQNRVNNAWQESRVALEIAAREAGIDTRAGNVDAMNVIDNLMEMPEVAAREAARRMGGEKFASAVSNVKAIHGEQPLRAKQLGVPLEELQDAAGIDYFGRQLVPEAFQHMDKVSAKPKRELSTFIEGSLGRKDYLKGFENQTATLRMMAQDEDIITAMKTGVREDTARVIEQKYGDVVPDTYEVPLPESAVGDTPLLDEAADAAAEVGKASETVTGRHKKLAEMFEHAGEEAMRKGLYIDPFRALQNRLEGQADALMAADSLAQTMADPNAIRTMTQVLGSRSNTDATRFGDMLNALGVRGYEVDELTGEANGMLAEIAKKRGLDPLDEEAVMTIADEFVPGELANDMKRYYETFTNPASVNILMDAAREYTGLFKAGVTSLWPNFHFRNQVSGIVRGVLSGAYGDDFKTAAVSAAKGIHNSRKIRTGRSVTGFKDVPSISSELIARGSGQTDEAATDLLVEKMATYFPDLAEKRIGMASRDGGRYSVSEFEIPGRETGTLWSGVKDEMKFADDRTMFLPKRGKKFAPVEAGGNLNQVVEFTTRFSAFSELVRRGYSFDEAARHVKNAQVDYSSRAYSDVERQWFTLAMPFYKFTSRQLPYMVRNLSEHPGGATSHAVQAMAAGKGDAEDRVTTPGYLRDGVAIPAGEDADGRRTYISGLGLMEETPFAFVPGGLRADSLGDAGLSGLSMLNPMMAAPMEYMTNRSFFHGGPLGGREQSNADPSIGRLMGNVRSLVTGEESRIPSFMQGENAEAARLAETVLRMTPLSRAVTTAKAATDTRPVSFNLPFAPESRLEGASAAAVKKAMNLLTGFRATTVEKDQRTRAAIDLANERARKMGARTINRAYFRDDQQSPETDRVEQFIRSLERKLK